MSDPHEWHIASDREGFFIEDEYGEEVTPPWLAFPAAWRTKGYDTAQKVLAETIADAIENYEPPDPPGWEGGFAENH